MLCICVCVCVCVFFLNFRFLISKFNDKIGSFALHSDEVFIDDSPRVLSVISSEDCPNKLCLIDSDADQKRVQDFSATCERSHSRQRSIAELAPKVPRSY
jgi:hypothetical protein